MVKRKICHCKNRNSDDPKFTAFDVISKIIEKNAKFLVSSNFTTLIKTHNANIVIKMPFYPF